MSKELIEEILEDLEKLKDKCYEVNFETADFKDASHYSFTFDKIEGLEKHLQEALETIKQKEKIWESMKQKKFKELN